MSVCYGRETWGNRTLADHEGILSASSLELLGAVRRTGESHVTELFGALLHFAPLTVLGAAVADGLFWVLLVKVFKVHSARARIVMLALVGPLLWALNLPWPTVVLGVLGSAVAIIKTLPDWNRVYG